MPVVFFFFQAEDGIRDATVTGVQTCALPISWRRECCIAAAGRDRTPSGRMARRMEAMRNTIWGWRWNSGWKKELHLRSEERRVGKEWRTRRAQYQYKINQV